MRLILILHRYLGVTVGVLMSVWCLSGFVMMYQGFPDFTAKERLQASEPLRLDECCNADLSGLADDAAVDGFRIDMLAGAPVLRLPSPEGERIVDLKSGRTVSAITPQMVAYAAQLFGEQGHLGPPSSIRVTPLDQWSVGGGKLHQPIYKVSYADPGATQVYVSGVTGQIFQDTNRRERLLSWIGAVPHWLYPTLLRANGPLWSQVVIWSSIIGVFLTATGLYVGVVRFRRYRSGRWSPYRGWFLWHHYAGLVFGVLTLTWVFSGLLTMGPFGVFESNAGDWHGVIAGPMTGKDVKAFVAAAPAAVLSRNDVVQLRSAPLGGAPWVMALTAEGGDTRLSVNGARPLARADIEASLAAAEVKVRSLDLISAEDAYYYGHHNSVELPVYRALLDDDQGTRLYLSPRSGQVLSAVDTAGRRARWLENGLHRLDFPGLKSRPIWDLVVLPLLAGVTLVCITGAWMSWLRVRRDVGDIVWRLTQPRPRRVPAHRGPLWGAGRSALSRFLRL